MEHEHETPELDQEFDPVFEEEQQHLTETYAKLQTMGRDLLAKMEANSKDAAEQKPGLPTSWPWSTSCR